MTPEQARTLLNRMKPVPECSMCGARNPPTKPVYDIDNERVVAHDGCPKHNKTFIPVVSQGAGMLLTADECFDALTTIIDLNYAIEDMMKIWERKP